MAQEIFDGLLGKTTRKHPDEIRNYIFDWSDWLTANNTNAVGMNVEDFKGLTKNSSTPNLSAGTFTVQMAGGTDGGLGYLRVSMTTADSQKDIRTLYFEIKAG
jgi:hypothetical protein